MAEALTRSQADIHNVLLEIEDHQRVFALNYKDSVGVARRRLVHEVTVGTAVGLVLGGLVGAVVGLSRGRRDTRPEVK